MMHVEDIRRVLIVGAGNMGPQIGWQCATHGYEVMVYDIDAAALTRAGTAIRGFADEFVADGRRTKAEIETALTRIQYTNSAEEAAVNVDLVSESIVEVCRAKRELFRQLGALCPARAIFTTNTSGLRPSSFAAASGRPDRLCALHFHPPVWLANFVEIMPHHETSPQAVATLMAFARRVGQMPLLVPRESPGYVFNFMLGAILTRALRLVAKGVASPEDVDRAWMGVTRMPCGPFGILDMIGLDLTHDIMRRKSGWLACLPRVRRLHAILKEHVDRGEFGMKTRKGFYDYPNPAYQRPGFLEGQADGS